MRKPNKNKMAGVNSRFASVSESIFNGFLLKMLLSECVYTKTIILLNLGEKWQNIYLAASRLGKYSATIHLDFKE